MADADGEEAITLKQLACEELLSEEQHLKLADVLLQGGHIGWKGWKGWNIIYFFQLVTGKAGNLDFF